MDGLGILLEGNVGRRLLDDAVGNRDDELDAAVLDVKVEKKDVVEVEKVPNKGESQKKLESVRDGEQKVQKLQDEEVDAAVLDVEQEMDKGVLVGNQERNDDAEEDGDQVDDDDVYHDEEGKKYFDWRLPKVWEAYQMYLALHVINQGNFSSSGYWTSQGPSSFDKMSLVNFSNGMEFNSLKVDTYRARAVRSF